MSASPLRLRLLYLFLGFLLSFLALNAFGGGYYGMAGAANVPLRWLEGSPFKDYMIPSIFLFVVIGGLALFSSILVFRKHHAALKASLFTGIIVSLWILIQLVIIGYVSWMQPFTAGLAMTIIFLSAMLPAMSSKKDHDSKIPDIE